MPDYEAFAAFSSECNAHYRELLDFEYKKIDFIHKKKTLRGFLFSKEIKYPNKLIIFCHGMYSTHENYIQEIASLVNLGYLVLGFDYYGVGISDGKNTLGIGNSLSSLNSLMNYIKNDKELSTKDIYVIGHSWGGYATTNIVKYHKEIKGIIGISPLISLKLIILNNTKGLSRIILPFYMLIDIFNCGKYSIANGLKSLRDYNGKIMLIQSKDDPVIKYDYSVGLIKEKLKNKNIKYLIFNNRLHNPTYTDNAINVMRKYSNDIINLKGKELKEYNRSFNFKEMGEIDTSVYDAIMGFINE